MGLTPRHQKPFQKKGWDQLNQFLKDVIDNSDQSDPSGTIKLSDYVMSSEEIQSELKKNGYSFDDSVNGYLTIR